MDGPHAGAVLPVSVVRPHGRGDQLVGPGSRPVLGVKDVLRRPGSPRRWSASPGSGTECRRSPVNDSLPAWKAATASSFAALNAAGTGRRPRRPPWPGPAPGTATWSTGSNVQADAVAKSHGAAAPASRSGQAAQRDRQPHVRRAGLGDRRPVDEGDHRVDHRLRVHHDVDPVVGTPNSRCASISSRPLFTRVAELIVTTGAHGPRRVGERVGQGDPLELARPTGRGTGRRRR